MAKLYVVATPIGNLNDLTPRMREALDAADLIAAEDTRVTMKLLSHFDLHRPMVSCHRHNEDWRASEIIQRMQSEDLTVALTCDAGTPGISDPGHLLVAAAWEAGIPVEAVSGPSAVPTCLSVSGFDAREFAFYGFLPREKKALREKLDSIHRAGVPVFVLYESPHRVLDLTEAIADVWPAAKVCLCCDLTKRYERVDRGRAAEVVRALKDNPNREKGEYCMAVDLSEVPPPEEARQAVSAEVYLLSQVVEGLSLGDAVKTGREAGFARNELYRAQLRIRDRLGDDGNFL